MRFPRTYVLRRGLKVLLTGRVPRGGGVTSRCPSPGDVLIACCRAEGEDITNDCMGRKIKEAKRFRPSQAQLESGEWVLTCAFPEQHTHDGLCYIQTKTVRHVKVFSPDEIEYTDGYTDSLYHCGWEYP